jgi:RHS repeat-associated protein
MRLAVIDSSNNSFDAALTYDGQDFILEGLSGGRARRYVRGPGIDEPLVAYLVTPTGTSRLWYQADERGSIVRHSNDAGTPDQIGKYDEYGVGGTGRIRYAGQYWLGDGNLIYSRARIYDARLGRFLQPDPIGYGSGMNIYAYVSGDPINLIDPLGLAPGECAGGTCEPFSVGRGFGALLPAGGGGRYQANMPGEGGGGVGEAPINCNPEAGDIFSDPRTATIAGARATAVRNNQNSDSASLQEFHANIRKVPGGFAFTLTPGPENGGSVPIGVNSPSSYGSAHNHERDSYGEKEGYLSSPTDNQRGHYTVDSDQKAYKTIFRAFPNLRQQLHIALAIGAKNGHIYYWPPGANLAKKGEDVGPTLCKGDK